jgi:hypothetical protein
VFPKRVQQDQRGNELPASPSVIRLILYIAVAVFATLAVSCATKTEISNQWKSPEYTGGPMHKILVVAITETPLVRRSYEDRFAEALQGHGAETVASYALWPGDKRLTKEELEEIVNRDGFDGVIVTQLLGVDEKTTYVPPTTEVVPMHRGRGYYGYYGRSYDVVHNPGYTLTTEIISLETKLWNARDSQLAWGIRSETFDASSTDDAIASVTKKLVKQLADDGLIAK